MARFHQLSSIAYFKPIDTGVTSTANGTAINTLGYDSVVIAVRTTTAAASTNTVKLQESADGSTGWTDITGATFAVAASKTDQMNLIDVNLQQGVRKQYLRTVMTITGTVNANSMATLTNADQVAVSQDQTAIIIVSA